MDITVLLRLAITVTFLLLAVGGPYALLKLNRFIRRYEVTHARLKKRVADIEKHIGITGNDHDMD